MEFVVGPSGVLCSVVLLAVVGSSVPEVLVPGPSLVEVLGPDVGPSVVEELAPSVVEVPRLCEVKSL